MAKKQIQTCSLVVVILTFLLLAPSIKPLRADCVSNCLGNGKITDEISKATCNRQCTADPNRYPTDPTVNPTTTPTPGSSGNPIPININDPFLKGWTPETSIPGLTAGPIKIAAYIDGLYKFIVIIIGILGAVMFLIGGFQYLISAGNNASVSSAKETMFAALAGMIIVFCGYLFLRTINKELVDLTDLNVPTPAAVPVTPKPAETPTKQMTPEEIKCLNCSALTSTECGKCSECKIQPASTEGSWEDTCVDKNSVPAG